MSLLTKLKQIGTTCQRIKCPLGSWLSIHTKIFNIQHFQLVTSWFLRKCDNFFITHFSKFIILTEKHSLKNLQKLLDVANMPRYYWHEFQIFWISPSSRSSEFSKTQFRAPTAVVVHNIWDPTLNSNFSVQDLSSNTYMS